MMIHVIIELINNINSIDFTPLLNKNGIANALKKKNKLNVGLYAYTK